MNSILHYFKNKWFYLALFAVLFQQILVATGTYYLGTITSQFPSKGFQLSLAIPLFFCISLPGTVVHYLIVILTTYANKASQKIYLDEYIKSNYNNPTHWRNESSKTRRHDIMCRGGQESIRSAVDFFVDLAATSLNIVLNTISIILATDFILGFLIIFSGFCGIGIINSFSKKISEKSRKEILAENQLNSHMSKSWDNIVLGNPSFFNRWIEKFNEIFKETIDFSIEVVKKRDLAISIASLVTNIMVLGGALFLAWTNQYREGFALAILVMMPRSLQTVMHMQIVQSYLARWKNLREKLVVTMESVLYLSPLDLNDFINKDLVNITFQNEKYKYQELEKLLEKFSFGRFTITGPNGVGKSSLLLELKEKYKTSAAYLPAQHQFILSNVSASPSSGEIALAGLNELQVEDYKILLLDEWDANLSKDNKAHLDQVIYKLSSQKIVIEVRHFD